MRYSVFVPGDPVPQGSMRARQAPHQRMPSVVPANQQALANWRAQVSAYIRQHIPTGDIPHDGTFAVQAEFMLRRPSSHFLPPNSRRMHPELKPDAPTYVTKAPDIDKLSRAVLDASTDAGVWNDDSQCVHIVASKRYANEPQAVGVTITYSVG